MRTCDCLLRGSLLSWSFFCNNFFGGSLFCDNFIYGTLLSCRTTCLLAFFGRTNYSHRASFGLPGLTLLTSGIDTHIIICPQPNLHIRAPFWVILSLNQRFAQQITHFFNLNQKAVVYQC